MTENQLKYLTLQETLRHNQATELDAAKRTAETVRSNLAREGETYRANVTQETETNRANVARETETSKHNRTTEGLATAEFFTDTLFRGLDTARKTATDIVDMAKILGLLI